MGDRLHHPPHAPPHRLPLGGQWSLLCRDPAAPGLPEEGAPAADDPRWIAIDGPATVAAALRSKGLWSLDAAPRDFDVQEWWYRAVFDRPSLPQGEPAASLGFAGLATHATVWLNAQQLLASDNMFTAHRCEVDGLLRERGNELLVRCAPLARALGARRPRPRWRTPMVAHPQLRFERTTLLGRTPGWSPPVAPVGPWRDVWLGPAQDAASSCRLDARVDRGEGVLTCQLPGAGAGERIEEAVLRVERGAWHAEAPMLPDGDAWAGTLRVPQVALWWPHTQGEPCLYRASIELRRAAGAPVRISLGSIGFRTVEVDTGGGAFRVLVNGEPVFCRGAVWTPLDIVSLRASPAQYHAALRQARAAGMNMLRVPGTGVYEEDAFYAACDEAGVLVWQDLMFASMDYPEETAFNASAEREVRQQLRRLRAHPCLAVVCGNSEVEQQAAMSAAPRERWQPPLFHELLPRLCREEAPAVPYWPSSAHGGPFPHAVSSGTTSYYGVGAYRRPLEDARRSGLRFATECLAFANIPAATALARLPGGLATRAHHPHWKARSPRDLGAGWDFDDVRDHYLQRLFGVDPAALRQHDHARYLVLGRLATAEAMAASFGEWRRGSSGCGGALVLQLRDFWAGAGWGLLDDAGAPKACFHALRRVLQPQAIWMTDEGLDGPHCHLANDRAESLAAQLDFTAWRGDAPVAAASRAVQLAPRTVCSLPAAELFDGFMDLNWAWRFGPPACDVIVASLRQGAALLGQAFLFPQGLLLPEAELGWECQVTASSSADAAVLSLRTRRVAVGVHFELPGWQADDEYFHLAPGALRQVRLQRAGATSALPHGCARAINAASQAPVVPAKAAVLEVPRDAVLPA